MRFNLAIDGPAGAGKSTIAKRVAKELSFVYVDTGAMYRAMGIYFSDLGIAPEEQEKIEAACKDVKISISYENGEQQVYLNGVNVTGRLRTEEAGKMASATSAYLEVRKKLVELQQEMAENTDLVMDGRDIGTAVLPNAPLKVYLTASAHVRALRRWKELTEKGQTADLAKIEEDINERDYQDMHREHSPLVQAEDAVLVDSSEMTIDEVVEKILSLARERMETRQREEENKNRWKYLLQKQQASASASNGRSIRYTVKLRAVKSRSTPSGRLFTTNRLWRISKTAVCR